MFNNILILLIFNIYIVETVNTIKSKLNQFGLDTFIFIFIMLKKIYLIVFNKFI